jgi:hypothetical protein
LWEKFGWETPGIWSPSPPDFFGKRETSAKKVQMAKVNNNNKIGIKENYFILNTSG